MSRSVPELAQEIEGNFSDSPFWQYEKTVGNGRYGLAFLVGQKAGGPTGFRMVVKVAIRDEIESLRNEIKIQQLNGAMHIVKMIASADTEFPNRDNNNFPPVSWAFESSKIRGPILGLEYIDGSNLLDPFRRMQAMRAHMPNRILWSLYLCLIRACIGMAYPVGAPLMSQTSTLETVTPDTPPILLKHNDIALRNIMIATENKEGEHAIGYIFKLIDFGGARIVDDRLQGPPENLYRISQAISVFITGRSLNILNQPGIYKGSETIGGYLLRLPGRVSRYPWLDPDLAGFMAECMYTDPAKRPDLQRALTVATNAVANKTHDMFPNPDEETDEAIEAFLQALVLDA
ncbi:hypothetical protein ANO14919_047590 [Xylariales sp. No.14919]|nr:hypothetical protein ANO14919_047590 [Xylariales sp. No.14919]